MAKILMTETRPGSLCAREFVSTDTTATPPSDDTSRVFSKGGENLDLPCDAVAPENAVQLQTGPPGAGHLERQLALQDGYLLGLQARYSRMRIQIHLLESEVRRLRARLPEIDDGSPEHSVEKLLDRLFEPEDHKELAP